MDTQLTTTSVNPFAIDSYDALERFAEKVAKSGMFGITKAEQAVCLFMICDAEGIKPAAALKRYHIIEGKPSMRADAMLAEFLARGGGVIWHIRTDSMVGATFFSDVSKIDDKARARSGLRFKALWTLSSASEPEAQSEATLTLADNAAEGEETTLRTYAECEEKGLTGGKDGVKVNWRKSPKAMLTARVITELTRLIDPGLIAGIYTPEEVEDFTADRAESKASYDTSAMKTIMEQHLDNAKDAPNDNERKRLLGLAAEMRCKISDDQIDVTPVEAPAKEMEFEVMGKDVEPIVMAPPVEETPWEEYKMRFVKNKSLLGKPLGTLSREDIGVLYERRCVPFLESNDANLREEAQYVDRAQKAWEACQQ